MSEPKAQKRPRRWKGKLAQKIHPRIIRPRGLAITSARAVRKANQQMAALYQKAVEREHDERLSLLLQYYGIAKNDFRRLAIRLAADLGIPGFQIASFQLTLDDPSSQTDGRDWTPERLDQLLAAVEDFKKRDHGSKTRDALEYLATTQRWGPPPNHWGNWLKTLENRHSEAKKLKHFVDDQVSKAWKLIRDCGGKIPSK